MKTFIVANWKLNPSTQKEAMNLFHAIKRGVKNIKNVEIVICPPFVYLPLFSGLTLGAQNVFFKEKGAFTGEVSSLMLKDLKVKYVILGHSEARQYLNETNEIINKKIKEVVSVKLKTIFCVGETAKEKQSNKKYEVLENQIREGLKGVLSKELKNIVIAYEPVWAIGTGKNCSVDETMSSMLFIRKIISKLYNREVANNIRIIYGGSVESKNSGLYIKDAGVNGLLVGRDSLNAENFIKIVKFVDQY